MDLHEHLQTAVLDEIRSEKDAIKAHIDQWKEFVTQECVSRTGNIRPLPETLIQRKPYHRIIASNFREWITGAVRTVTVEIQHPPWRLVFGKINPLSPSSDRPFRVSSALGEKANS